MQSRARALKRGSFGVRHKTTKNRKGQQYRMQLITKAKFASDANQKLHNTLFHLNSAWS